MKKLLFFSILTIVFTINSIAQDKTADLKVLFELMKTESMIDAQISNMIPMLKQQASEQIQGSDAQMKFDEYLSFMLKEVKELSNKLINEEMIDIYDKHFTHEEIIDLIKFYESPIGKKILEKTPEITADLMNSMMTKFMPEFQEKLYKKLEELK